MSVQPLREGQGGTEGLGGPLEAESCLSGLGLGGFARGAESRSGRGPWPTLSILYTGKMDTSAEENVAAAYQSPVHRSLILRPRP